jgi:hypothetical protein
MDPTGMAPDDIYSYEGKEVARLKNGQPDRTFDVKPGEGGWEVQLIKPIFGGHHLINNLEMKILISLIGILVAGCGISKKNLCGVYTVKKSINTADTLVIRENGEYYRVLYRKKEKSVVYKNNDKWEFRDGRITLYNFLLDEDDVYDVKLKNFDNVLITSSFPVIKKSGTITFYHRNLNPDLFYEKIGQ